MNKGWLVEKHNRERRKLIEDQNKKEKQRLANRTPEEVLIEDQKDEEKRKLQDKDEYDRLEHWYFNDYVKTRSVLFDLLIKRCDNSSGTFKLPNNMINIADFGLMPINTFIEREYNDFSNHRPSPALQRRLEEDFQQYCNENGLRVDGYYNSET